jgi:hypothetical protein
VALLSRVGGSGDNFTGTGFKDQAATPITSGSAPFDDTFMPREPLAQLINELVNGKWTLNVRDQAAGNVGTLESWSLGSASRPSIDGRTQGDSRRGDAAVDHRRGRPLLTTVPGTAASGVGGDVTVKAGVVTVRNGATMSAITRGSGRGGTVTLDISGDVSVLSNARIATARSRRSAGNVRIDARNLLVDRPRSRAMHPARRAVKPEA